MLQIEHGRTAEGQAFQTSERPMARFERGLGVVGNMDVISHSSYLVAIR